MHQTRPSQAGFVSSLILAAALLGVPAQGSNETQSSELDVATSPPLPSPSAGNRHARIRANLLLHFPQLEDKEIAFGVIEPSAWRGLDRGSFTVDERTQNFFVSSDDSELYMVSESIDVSRSRQDIGEELARRRAEAAETEQVSARLRTATWGSPVRGSTSAPVTIVEFCGFRNPYCGRTAGVVEQILERYPYDVNYVFLHFPLDHSSWPAAIASECATQQSSAAFWTLHDQYFANMKELGGNLLAKSEEFLVRSGVDLRRFGECVSVSDSPAHRAAAAAVDADIALGKELGVSATPSFFVNGRFLKGAHPLSVFEPVIAEAKNPTPAAEPLPSWFTALSPDASGQWGLSDRINANLLLRYPQLEDQEITFGPIGESNWPGLDQGSLSMSGRVQKFFVSGNELYMVSDPIDVSLSLPEIEAELEERRADDDQ